MNYLEAQLGFKGERGYSAYEIAVQNGYEGTEQDWLATLGTSSHFSQDSTSYIAVEGQTDFNLPTTYTSDSFVSVYVDGKKLSEDEYTIANNKVVLTNSATEGTKVEVVEVSMSTNNLPIVTTLSADSTNDTVPGALYVYTNILTVLQNLQVLVNSLFNKNSSSNMNTKVDSNKDETDQDISDLTSTVSTNTNNIASLTNSKQNNVLSGTTSPSSNLGVDGDIYFQYS